MGNITQQFLLRLQRGNGYENSCRMKRQWECDYTCVSIGTSTEAGTSNDALIIPAKSVEGYQRKFGHNATISSFHRARSEMLCLTRSCLTPHRGASSSRRMIHTSLVLFWNIFSRSPIMGCWYRRPLSLMWVVTKHGSYISDGFRGSHQARFLTAQSS